MKIIDGLKIPTPKKPTPVKVRIPGECPDCNNSFGHESEQKQIRQEEKS